MFTDQVLCPSEFSDPVLPVQEHCLLHRTGVVTTLKLFQREHFYIFIFSYFHIFIFSFFDPDLSNFQVLYMFYSNFSAQVSTFHFGFKVQHLAHCFRVLLNTNENTFQVCIDLKMLQTLFESTFLVLYNTIYTSIPGRSQAMGSF